MWLIISVVVAVLVVAYVVLCLAVLWRLFNDFCQQGAQGEMSAKTRGAKR